MVEDERREEFKKIIAGIKSVYNNFGVKEKTQFDFWYNILKDIDINILKIAVTEYITTNKFPPTIADIRALSANAQKGEIKDAGGCWGEVVKSIGRYGQYQEEKALENMDQMTRECVKRLGWKQICLSENLMADRAHFLKIYEQVSKRETHSRQVPLSIRQKKAKMIADNKIKMIADEMNID